MSPLTIIFCLPFVAALLILATPRDNRAAIRGIALAATLGSLLAAIFTFCQYGSAAIGEGGFRFVQKVEWVKSLGISYFVGVDGINLGLILMGAVVAFAAVCVSKRIEKMEKEFYLLLMVMIGGIFGAFVTLDLFCFYFFHELALVPTFIMIGLWGKGEEKNFATFQITLYLSLGALMVLIGLIALWLNLPVDQRTFDMVKLTAYFKAHHLATGAQHLIFPLLLFGFGILVSLWPFHSWAPLGYGSAPTATAMMHAGVLKKFGLYGLIRIALPFMPDESKLWMQLLAYLCLGNILFCGLVAIRQKNLNLLIGNSSVAHMGFAFLGIASLNVIGLTGTVLIMVAHGFLAALTFALSGYVYEQTGTLDMNKMGGLLPKFPFIGTVMIMAMLAGCGLPGFANFPGEAMVLFGSWGPFKLASVNFSVITALAAWGALVIGGVYMLRAIRTIWHGDKKQSDYTDATGFGRLPYAMLLCGLLIFGCYPKLLSDPIKASAQPLIEMATGTTADPAPSVAAIPAQLHLTKQ